MREKIRANDLSVLFICPSDEWGTLERRVINDCHYLRDIGGSPVLYCIKGSPIDREAQKLSLPRQFYKGKKVNKIFDLTYFIDIKKVISENKFDIIHCFSLDYVWTICFLLMTKPHLPLLLTFNRFLKKAQKSFLERWLFKRIDLIMTFSSDIRKMVLSNLPVSAKKVQVVGAGVEIFRPKEESKENDLKIIGCFVTNKTQIENLNAFLYLVKPLMAHYKESEMNLRLLAFSDRPMEEIFDMSRVEQLIEELEIKENIHFVETQRIDEAIRKMDIYVSLAFDEPFSDLEIMASLSKVPIVAPRTPARRQLLAKLPGIGHTFYFQDSRELRAKIEKLLASEDYYHSALEQNFERLNSSHGLDNYVEKVYDFYIRLYSQRLRFASLKVNAN